MSDPIRDAWTEVGAGFSNLGTSISSKFGQTRSTAEPGADERDPDAAAPPGRPPGDDPPSDDAELRAAFDRFVTAGRDLGDRLVGIGRDEEVRSRAREASRNLDAALVTTVDAITDRLSGLAGRDHQAGPDAHGQPTPNDHPESPNVSGPR